MDGPEVVAALREAYQSGGLRLLSAIADDIREHGPLHDPEWILCLDCGHEFERPQSAVLNGGSHPVRCPTCLDLNKTAVRARRYLKEKR